MELHSGGNMMALQQILCLLILFSSFQSTRSKVYLELQKRIFLPIERTFDLDDFLFNIDAAVKIAYDEKRKLIFAVGNDLLHVINAGTSGILTRLTSRRESAFFKFTDVILCDDLIVTTREGDLDAGQIMIYTYNSDLNVLNLEFQGFIGEFKEDRRPVSIVGNKECTSFYVAMEGNPIPGETEVVDPFGAILLIRFASREFKTSSFITVNFKSLDSRVAQLVTDGVRFVYRDNGNTLSRDLEPQKIILNSDETKAYVLCQENNAMIVLNITDESKLTIDDVIPFKTKLWKDSGLDASEFDNGINIKPAEILALLQPFDMKMFLHEGEEYIVTANEGNSKEIGDGTTPLFTDVKTGLKFVNEDLIADSVSADLKAALGDPTHLGELEFSTVDGLDETTQKYTQFYAFGGRSISLIRTRDNEMIYDSGSSLETTIAAEYPLFFNTKPSPGFKPPAEIGEDRSYIRGPEPKALEVGKAYGKTLVFVGSENPGTISIYSMATSDNANGVTPKFESVFFGADFRHNELWRNVYTERRTGDLDPNDIIFVPSTNAYEPPLLYVAGKLSGTVSCYKVLSDEPSPVKPTKPWKPIQPTPIPRRPRPPHFPRPRGSYNHQHNSGPNYKK